jgi:23S rRNA-/tRNA-specific pseudouridylate synthase
VVNKPAGLVVHPGRGHSSTGCSPGPDSSVP